MSPEALAARIAALPGPRTLTAIAGPPASGKSTFAARVVRPLGADGALVAMDGFHLDDRVLRARGLLARKGAPETFDLAGLRRALDALRAGEEVVVPQFDRAREIAIAGAHVIPTEARHVVVEGNWLLLDRPGWRELTWDLSVMLETSEAELRRRLARRWRDHPDAASKIEGNDLPNARLVREASRPATLKLRDGAWDGG
ncbi:MAG: nucleoside/nucleotide kinase family protein [Shimia sp.]